MKYLETNEGLFSKDEIPKKLIDDIKADIQKKYPVTIKRLPADEKRGIFDRVTFITDTPIGDISAVITLTYDDVKKGYLGSKFARKILKFDIYHIKNRLSYVGSDTKLKDWKDIDINSVIHNIDYVIQRVTTESKQKKELADFYGKITEGEIKDLAADLYDLIGYYKLSKTTVKGKKGFQLLFDLKLDFIDRSERGILTAANQIGNDRYVVFFRPTDQHIDILKEINSLSKRLDDGYDLNLIYEFTKDRTLRVLIYQKSEK